MYVHTYLLHQKDASSSGLRNPDDPIKKDTYVINLCVVAVSQRDDQHDDISELPCFLTNEIFLIHTLLFTASSIWRSFAYAYT